MDKELISIVATIKDGMNKHKASQAYKINITNLIKLSGKSVVGISVIS